MEKDIKVKGLVLREVQVGEADKILSIVCEGIGRIDVSGRGVRSLRSPHMAATQIFSYSSFLLRRGKKYYYIAESALIEPFFGIRSNLDRLSLAAYMADVTLDLLPEGICDDGLLRLALNTFYAMSEKTDIPIRLIKGAFEMRAAVSAGFLPDLSACLRCGSESSEKMYLDVMNGGIVCDGCRTPVALDSAASGTSSIHLPLTPAQLSALRFVCSADEKKFLSFVLDKSETAGFESVCERYLLEHLEHGFHSLDFYRSVLTE